MMDGRGILKMAAFAGKALVTKLACPCSCRMHMFFPAVHSCGAATAVVHRCQPENLAPSVPVLTPLYLLAYVLATDVT